MASAFTKSFYFVRHGESESNKLQVMCGGGIDTPLTNLGREQAEFAKSIMQAVVSQKPQIVYCSDLSRASDTARILNQALNTPMVEMQELREHHMGDWEGKPWQEVVPKLEKKENPQNGETFDEFHLRVKETLTKILNNNLIPLIVSHGGFWHALGHLHKHKSLEWPENAGIYYFDAHNENRSFPWVVSFLRRDENGQSLKVDKTHIFEPYTKEVGTI